MDIDENKGSRSQERTKWGIIGEGLKYLTGFMSKYTLFHYILWDLPDFLLNPICQNTIIYKYWIKDTEIFLKLKQTGFFNDTNFDSNFVQKKN